MLYKSLNFKLKIYNPGKNVAYLVQVIFAFDIKKLKNINLYVVKILKNCGRFYCGQSSDNVFWTPHDLK